MLAITSFFKEFITFWPDLLWLPVAALIVHKGQKLKALFFVFVCVASLRLQMELIQSTGFTKGLTGWVQMSSFQRGLLVYAIFIAGYLLLSYLSPYTKGPIYLAASLSIYFFAFIASSFVMMI